MPRTTDSFRLVSTRYPVGRFSSSASRLGSGWHEVQGRIGWVSHTPATPDRPYGAGMKAVCGHWMRGAGVACGRPAGHEPPHRPANHDTEPGQRVRGLTAADLDHRDQFGVALDQNQKLPAAAGATGLAAGQKPTPRQRGRRNRTPNTAKTNAGKRVRATTVKHQQDIGAPAAGTVVAKFAGTCGGCSQRYPKGTSLGRIGEGWGHNECAKIMRETERIRSGETFRSQQASTWRRGAGPGQSRSRF